VNYLLDTHALVWSHVSPRELSAKVRSLFEAGDGTFWVSAVSFWEVSIKYVIGKLDLNQTTPSELYEYSLDAGFKILNLDAKFAANFYKLTRLKNKDPFDRLLAWQAINENMILLSKDKGFDDYKKFGLKRAWR